MVVFDTLVYSNIAFTIILALNVAIAVTLIRILRSMQRTESREED
ncbi:hypothetical protein ACFLTZ_01990 [Chloroflexota bacterium]